MKLDGDEAGEGDSQWLSKDKSKEYTHTDASENLIELEHVEIGHVRNLNPGVGEGEDRHYQEVDPRAESVLKTVAHPDGVSGDR